MIARYHTPSALALAFVAIPLLTVLPAFSQESTIEGVLAMPGTEAAVSGRMTVRDSGPLRRDIELIYTDAATGEQVEQYDVELTQELHILAVDAQLNVLVHEHVRAADNNGRFVAELQFPHPGTYHIYTDAVPTGLGQQVMRFDLPVGEGSGHEGEETAPSDVTAGAVSSSVGAYTVQLDASQLRSGEEGVMSLTVLKDGQPAEDLAPYLGVAAHAVLIRAEDLAYVHAHALAEDETGGGAQHDGHGSHAAASGHGPEHSVPHDAAAGGSGHATGEHGTSHGAGHGHQENGSGAHEGIMGAPGTIPAELMVHVTPPAPGTYGLWIEFVGGDQVITVPFKIEVPVT